MMPGTGGPPIPNRCATAWGTEGRHAAIAFCWLCTAAIFRQPSILRNLI